MSAVIGQRLDALLDVVQGLESDLQLIVGQAVQHVGCDRIAQAVEFVDQLPPFRCQEQAVGAAVFRIVPPLQQAALDQAIEQPHQRDRLQLQHVGEVDLGQALILTQPKQYDPLRASRPALLGAVVDVVAQQSRTLYELCNELPLKVE